MTIRDVNMYLSRFIVFSSPLEEACKQLDSYILKMKEIKNLKGRQKTKKQKK